MFSVRRFSGGAFHPAPTSGNVVVGAGGFDVVLDVLDVVLAVLDVVDVVVAVSTVVVAAASVAVGAGPESTVTMVADRSDVDAVDSPADGIVDAGPVPPGDVPGLPSAEVSSLPEHPTRAATVMRASADRDRAMTRVCPRPVRRERRVRRLICRGTARYVRVGSGAE